MMAFFAEFRHALPWIIPPWAITRNVMRCQGPCRAGRPRLSRKWKNQSAVWITKNRAPPWGIEDADEGWKNGAPGIGY